MATTILTDAFFLINAVDLSDHVISMEYEELVDQQDATAMGGTTKITKPGLFDGSLKVKLFQDFAAAKVDQTISPLLGTTTSIEVRPAKAGGRSTTNPGWTFTGSISKYNPIAGKVGDIQQCTLEIELASAFVRNTA